MREATAAFAQVAAGSHLLVCYGEVLFNRQPVATGINIADGACQYNRNAAIRSRLSCVLAEPTRLPLDSDDIFTPFGYELRIWRGVGLDPGSGVYLFRDGVQLMYGSDNLTIGNPEPSVEVVALGTFPIQVSDIDGVFLDTTITAEDRMRLVSDAGFEDDYPIADGTNVIEAVQALIEDGVSGLEFLFPTTEFTMPAVVLSPGMDRAEQAMKMMRSIGLELFFDGLGRCCAKPIPTFEGVPQFTIFEGENLIDIRYRLDRGPAFNQVTAVSSNASNGARFTASATDDDPSSPTYYEGPFGKKSRKQPLTSEFFGSTEQCQVAADAELAGNLGVSASAPGTAVPNALMEVSDLVHIKRSVLGIDDLHIIETMSIGLGPQASMPFTTRAKQVVA